MTSCITMIILLLLLLGILLEVSKCSHYCDDVSTSFSDSQTCDEGHVRDSLRQNTECRPRPIIMRLPWPNNTNIQQMTPSYVEINQCDGACHGNRHSCVVTRKAIKKIPVMLAKCGIRTGKCSKECVDVRIEDHVECGCECELGEVDCGGETHHFVPDMCACQCKNLQSRRQCLDQGRIWSEQDCSCGCPAVHTCSSGSTYSNTTCSCSVQIQTDIVTGQRTQRSNNQDLFAWEIVIIITLLVLIFIMLVIIFSLISKIQSCGRKLAAINNKSELVKDSFNYKQQKKICPPIDEHHYPTIYSYPSTEDDIIDRLPDPSCEECYYAGVGSAGLQEHVGDRHHKLGEAVRLLQHSMAR